MDELKSFFVLAISAIACTLFLAFVEWGFYGHRLINRMAVFTLPPEMITFYKANLDYITSHAIDPDKRRYAVPIEGLRHYMDMDELADRQVLSRNLAEDVFRNARFSTVTEDSRHVVDGWSFDSLSAHVDSTSIDLMRKNVQDELWSFMARGKLNIHIDDMPCFCNQVGCSAGDMEWVLIDSFSHNGILPYHLGMHQRWLEMAFRRGDYIKVLQLSAELGHYIADAHVPLHTTKNYNGQLTGQLGIHAFWETRLPELFAADYYDFVVQPAELISDPDSFFWQVVYDSHDKVNDVLAAERKVSEDLENDNRWCYTERNGSVQRLECRTYAKRFQEEINGMVEEQMRKAIWSIGSAWYTAWINAGRPVLDKDLNLDRILPGGLVLGDTLNSVNIDRFVRPHE